MCAPQFALDLHWIIMMKEEEWANESAKRTFFQRHKQVMNHFLAGGIAGCCAKSAVAPFDRVKILLQAHNQHYKHLGVFGTVSQVIRTEGPLGLYRGNGAQMIRIFPYAAIQFTSYEFFKQKFSEWSRNSHYLAAGSLAGLTAVLFTYPLDVIRARLAFQVAGDEMYRGIRHAFHTMVTKEGGVRALYKGIVPTLLGMAPYAGLSFYGFETLKQLCIDYFPHTLCKPLRSGGADHHLVLIIPAKLLCGGFAGAFAQTVSYPLDVARRKMQVALMLQAQDSAKFRSATWYRTLALVLREHGVRKGLYRGLSINYMKVTPMVAVSFCTYELMKQWLHMDTSGEPS